tara:strand:- start:2084 stop:2326 length:243 start_codon:yes stop_codon:yes gene_type:complete
MIALHFPNVSKADLAKRLGPQIAYIREGLNGVDRDKTNDEKALWLIEHILVNLEDLEAVNKNKFKFDRIAKGNTWHDRLR